MNYKSKEFRAKLMEAINSGRTTDWEYDGEDEVEVIRFDSDFACDAVIELLSVSKRYFLFECVNADKQKLNKLIIATDRESAIADIETSYPYIERWYTIEELNVC